MKRVIYFDPSCDAAAAKLGGYEVVDKSLEALWDGLLRNPFGFSLIENEFTRARFAVTRPVKGCPALIWIFEIDGNNNVTLKHVEEHEPY